VAIGRGRLVNGRSLPGDNSDHRADTTDDNGGESSGDTVPVFPARRVRRRGPKRGCEATVRLALDIGHAAVTLARAAQIPGSSITSTMNMTGAEQRPRRMCWTSCVVVVVLACRCLAQESPTVKPGDVGVSATKVQELSTFMQSLVDQGKISGGVTMMARHGKVVHLKAVGMADREEKKPMQTDAIFRLASMSKPPTSVAIMMLHERGKLDLDDPVSKFIPAFKDPNVLVTVDPLTTEPAKREITIRHLLTHTSGLGYPFTKLLGPLYEQHNIPSGCVSTSVTLEENMKRLAGLPLLFSPGERWEYGMSTDVLGRVVEVASAVPLDRFLEERVFSPLGMKDTFFKVPSRKLPRLVSAYFPAEGAIRKLKDSEIVKDGHELISADYPYLESHKYVSGGGGLCSTAADYMRFCEMLANLGELNGARLLREDTVKEMTTNQLVNLPDRFGFGFGISGDTDDIHKQLRGSYGWAGYWSTSFRISRQRDWILITMSQVAWDDKATPMWFAEYEKIAAESIEK